LSVPAVLAGTSPRDLHLASGGVGRVNDYPAHRGADPGGAWVAAADPRAARLCPRSARLFDRRTIAAEDFVSRPRTAEPGRRLAAGWLLTALRLVGLVGHSAAPDAPPLAARQPRHREAEYAREHQAAASDAQAEPVR
jgi:hypothetical protein